MLLGLVLGVVGGAMIPFQTAVNSRLSGRLGSVLPASLVSFLVGLVGLALVTLATGTQLPLVATAMGQPWWIWLGGLCGLVFLTMNMVLLPRIGASATVVLPLVGQVFGGLAIDMTGAFETAVRPLSLLRALGAVLVVVGAAMVNLAGRTALLEGAPPVRKPHLLLWVAAVLVGALGAVQTAVNGRLGEVMGSALAATLVSFLVGTIGLVVAVGASRPRLKPTGPFPLWMFTGGLLGASFVLVNALNAPLLGISLAVSVVLLGQVATGLLMDHRGWLGISRRPITAPRLAGAALVLAGVALVRFAT